jgi:hypothetical protein
MKVNAGWILFVIALCFIVLIQLCGKAVKTDSTKAEEEALQQRIKDTAKYYQQLLWNRQVQQDSAAAARAVLKEKFDQSQQRLTASQITINRLIAKVEGAKLEPRDSTFIPVSPQYISGCDSLKDQARLQQEKIDQYEEDGAKVNELMLYEIAIRDSTINAQKEFNRKFSNQLDDCMTQLQAKVNQKPRNQVYAGIGVFGNQINPLAGGQVNISLKTRGNKIYEITGATVGNVWYAGLGTKLLISFKR